MYSLISKLYPKKLKEKYFKLIYYSGIKIRPERFLGFALIFGTLLALTMAIYLAIFLKLNFWIMIPICFFVVQVMLYFFLVLRSEKKAHFVETILPDVLQLMASNLRAGYTTDRALMLSARPEFGPFRDELNLVGKQITVGTSVEDALKDLSSRINSEKLEKTITLIVSGMKAGGELSSLLEQTGKNLRQQELVDSRIRANVMMYVIFIFAAICFGAPLLLSLSSFLSDVMGMSLQGLTLPTDLQYDIPIRFQDIAISSSFLTMYSVSFLLASSFFGSLILGLISKGKETAGIKYMPVLMVASVVMFFLTRYLVEILLSGFFAT